MARHYFHLRKGEKGLVRQFLAEEAGLSRAQLFRVLSQYRATGEIKDRRGAPRRPFPRRYTDADIELLAEVDALHGGLSGPVTRKLCARAYHLFGDQRFERLARISNGHLYNLRRSRTYRRHRAATPTGERPLLRAIGDRGQPQPPELPGNVRVSSLYVDARAEGLRFLSFLDEATGFRFVGSVERVDAASVAAVLDGLRQALPFGLRRFLPDSGSEPVGRGVAVLLESLHRERPNRFEGGGKTVPDVRNTSAAERVNTFARESLSPFLNYHRLCVYPAEPLDSEGDDGMRPPRAPDIMTPYERLRSLPGAEACLTSGTTVRRSRRCRLRHERQRSRPASDRRLRAAVQVPGGRRLNGTGGTRLLPVRSHLSLEGAGHAVICARCPPPRTLRALPSPPAPTSRSS